MWQADLTFNLVHKQLIHVNYDIENNVCLFALNFMKINCWSWLMPSFTQNTDGIWMIWMLVQQPCGYMHSFSIKGPLKVFCEQSNGKSDKYSPIQKLTIEIPPYGFVCCMLKGNKRTFRTLMKGSCYMDIV